MIKYQAYIVEKSDRNNFQVSREVNTKDGSHKTTPLSYHGDLTSALRSLRLKLISDGFRSDTKSLEDFLKKEKDITEDFEKFLELLGAAEITKQLSIAEELAKKSVRLQNDNKTSSSV